MFSRSQFVSSTVFLTVVLGAAALIATSATRAAGAGTPLLPDLEALPADNLSFDVVRLNGGRHNVLRFGTTIWNAGQGRMELRSPKKSQQVYQYVYDAPAGGSLVQQLFVGNDIAFSKDHNHFHVEDFAQYTLLQQSATGQFSAVSKGTKTSFCIEDMSRLTGTYAGEYAQCGISVQGLTVGWADTYVASLPEQWVDLGPVRGGGPPLADGEYALQIQANPAGHLSEERSDNNSSLRYFSVTAGVIIPH